MDAAFVATHWLMAGQAQTHTFVFSALLSQYHWPLEVCWIELRFPLQILNKVDDTEGITIHSPLSIAANMLLNLRAISPVITKQ